MLFSNLEIAKKLTFYQRIGYEFILYIFRSILDLLFRFYDYI